jgi:hypothetical protein
MVGRLRLLIALLLVATSAVAFSTYGASPAKAAPSAGDEVLVQLAAQLGEPRHYCVDIPGYPFPNDLSTYREALWALEAHTCKTGVPNQDAAFADQVVSLAGLQAGQIRFSRLNVCLEVSTFTDDTGVTVREDAPMIINPCTNTPAQQIVLAADGRVHPAIDATKCLTVATKALEAGNRTPTELWYRRPMTFSTCTAGASARQVWAAVTPPPQNATPPAPAEPRDPPGVLQQLWSVVGVPDDGVGAPVPDETFIQSSNSLGEPRHFCVDVPGFPVTGDINKHREAKWALEGHTCKTGIPNQDLATMDQMISRSALANGQLRYTRLNVCLEISVLTSASGAMSVWEDAPTLVNPCSSTPAQQVVLGKDGRIRSAIDKSKCLTLYGEPFEAGNRAPGEPWYRRLLTFSTCAPAKHSTTVAHVVRPGGSRISVVVHVVGGHPAPTGTVRLLASGTTIGQAELRFAGTTVITIPRTALPPGRHQIDVLYSGDTEHVSSSGSINLA